MPGQTNGIPEKLPQSFEVMDPSQGKVEVGTQDGNAQKISMNSLKDLGKAFRDLKSLPGFTATKNPTEGTVKADITGNSTSVRKLERDGASENQELVNVRDQHKDERREVNSEVKPEGTWTKGELSTKPQSEDLKIASQRTKGAATGFVKPPKGWGNTDKETMMEFRNALLKGSADDVKAMIEKDPDIVNGCENMYLRPLELAAISGDKNKIEIIMNSDKLNVNIVDDNGHTMLHRAALIGDPDNIHGILSDHVPEDLEGIKEHKGEFDKNPSGIAKHFKFEDLATNLEPVNLARSEPTKQTAETKSPATSKKAETSSKEPGTLSQNIKKLNQLTNSGKIGKVNDFLKKNNERIKSLVNGFPNDPGGPLIRAALKKNREMVKLLMTQGAQSNITREGRPLQEALDKMEGMEEAFLLIKDVGEEVKSGKSEAAEKAPSGEEAPETNLTQEADKLQKQLDSFLSAKGLAEEDKALIKEGLQNLQKTLGEFETDQGKDSAKAVLDAINGLTKYIDKATSPKQEKLSNEQKTLLKEQDEISTKRRRRSTKLKERFSSKARTEGEQKQKELTTKQEQITASLNEISALKEKAAAAAPSLRKMSRTVLEKSEVPTPSVSGGEKLYEGKLKSAVEELRKTEKTYNTNLKGYLNVLKDLKAQGVIDDKQFNDLAGGLEPIVESSNAILDSLNSRDLSADLVAETFTNGRQAEIGRRHVPYLANYGTGIVPVLDKLKKSQNSKAIESAMKKAGLDSRMSLGEYAILPVQRMPRYNMLLDEIGKRSNNSQVLQRKEFQEVASKFVNTEVGIHQVAPPAGDAEQAATLPPVSPRSGWANAERKEGPQRKTEIGSQRKSGWTNAERKEGPQRKTEIGSQRKSGWTNAERKEGPQRKTEIGSQRKAEHSEAEKPETPPPLPPRDKEGISETAEETSRPAKPPETEDKTTEEKPPPGSLADRLREVKLKKTGGREQTEQPKEETGMQGALKNAVNRANVPEGEESDSSIGVDEKEWDEDTTEASAEAEEAPPVPEREELDETPPPLPERPEVKKVDTQGAPKPSDTTEEEVNLANEMAKRRGAIASDDDEEVEEENDDWLENL